MDSGILIFLLEQKKAFAVSISLWAQIALLHSSLLPSRLVPALRRPPPVRCTFVLLFCYTQYLWFFFFFTCESNKMDPSGRSSKLPLREIPPYLGLGVQMNTNVRAPMRGSITGSSSGTGTDIRPESSTPLCLPSWVWWMWRS